MMMPFVASITVAVKPISDNLEEHEQRGETDLAGFPQNAFFRIRRRLYLPRRYSRSTQRDP